MLTFNVHSEEINLGVVAGKEWRVSKDKQYANQEAFATVQGFCNSTGKR